MKQSDRAFGISFAILFAIISLVIWLVFDLVLTWTIVVSGLFLITACVMPWLLLPLNRLWGAIAHRIGQFNNYLILGIFFLLVMLPVALVMRLLGRDPMSRRLSDEDGSYWSPVRRHTTADTLRDPL